MYIICHQCKDSLVSGLLKNVLILKKQSKPENNNVPLKGKVHSLWMGHNLTILWQQIDML